MEQQQAASNHQPHDSQTLPELRTFVNVIYARIVIYTLHVFFNLNFIYTLLVLIFTLNVYIFTLNVLIYTRHVLIITLNA